MGSPDFAVPILHALVNNYPVVGVVTQPDKPSGRGKLLSPPPIKIEAERLGLQYVQPLRLRDPLATDRIKQWAPDVIIVAAYGQILRQELLDLPRFGCVNVHASLLPRWRGAAPIQAAILAGDDLTGITIMKMDAGLDSGPILSQRIIPITLQDTSGSLSSKLAKMGAELLIDTLPGYLSGSITAFPQDDSRITKAPMLSKQQGELDFTHDAAYLERQIRAYRPWPGCFTTWHGQTLKIHSAHAVSMRSPAIGCLLVVDSKPAWGTASGVLVADELQPAGKRIMLAAEFMRGNRNWAV